jgi:hypothetical protein
LASAVLGMEPNNRKTKIEIKKIKKETLKGSSFFE